jgi:25S rRNA (uracil2634-N3)-methyltransferase
MGRRHGLAAALQAAVRAAGASAARKAVGRGRPVTSVGALQRQARRAAEERARDRRREQEHAEAVGAARDADRRAAEPHTALRDRYHPHRRTLLLGEGNLSFALALARHWAAAHATPSAAAATPMPTAEADGDEEEAATAAAAVVAPEGPAAQLVATVFDSADDLAAKYDDAPAHAAALVALGAAVVYSVDATALGSPAQAARHGCLASAHVVAFHFPHVGLGIKDMDRNVRENQRLLQAFFAAVPAVLAPPASRGRRHRPGRAEDDEDPGRAEDDEDDEGGRGRQPRRPHDRVGRVGPSKRDRGDGGGEVHVTVRRGAPYDAWQVVKLARAAGLALVDALPFDPRAFPGYAHRRTLGAVPGVSRLANEEILPKHCVTYVFQRAVPA